MNTKLILIKAVLWQSHLVRHICCSLIPPLKPKAAKEPACPSPLTTTKIFLNNKFHSHHDSFKIHPTYNTDGRVNKLVTLFAFAPAPKTAL